MFPRTHFLGLCRELRDLIYHHYVTVEGGYVFNPESGKLTTVDNKPIDFALQLTCRQIGSEMQGLALKTNTIHFATSCSEEAGQKAGKLQFLVNGLRFLRNGLLTFAGPCITPEVTAHVAQYHKEFLPVLHRLSEGWNTVPFNLAGKECGHAPSLSRLFVDSTVDILARHPKLKEIIPRWNSICRGNDPLPDMKELLSMRYPDWNIPTEEDIAQLSQVVYEPKDHYEDRHCFSAAAVLIQWLGSLPILVRRQIRNITLLEDRKAVAFPASHAQGLIPFCQENPHLRIERRVNLWRNAFPLGEDSMAFDNSPDVIQRYGYNALSAFDVTDAIAPWITEALALQAYGMPPDAFTLVLDGDPIPDKTSQVFQVVQRDAA